MKIPEVKRVFKIFLCICTSIIDSFVKSLLMALCANVTDIYNQLPDASGNRRRLDINALALVKKFGLKVIATVSMVTNGPVWNSVCFADFHA